MNPFRLAPLANTLTKTPNPKIVLHKKLHLLTKICINYMYLLLDDIIVPQNPCVPTPCGLYSNCRAQNGHAVCSCVANYIGAPPNCRPECMSSSDCSQDKSCINERCKDPCPGTCGNNALCRTVNHNPICSCMTGFTGDPFVRCIYEESKIIVSFFACCIAFIHSFPVQN